MNSDEAKFILQAYRPGGQDMSDPQIAAALEQAQRDPKLAKWFAEQRAFDAAMVQKLNTVPVPADLKATILAGRKVVRPTPWWSRRLHPIAVAASLALAFATIGLLAGHEPAEPPADFKHFTGDLTDHLSKGYGILSKDAKPPVESAGYFNDQAYRMNFRSPNLEDIQSWLGMNGGHTGFREMRGLKQSDHLGCNVLNWRGHRVTLIAFHTGHSLPHDKVHVAIIDSASLPDAPAPRIPSVVELGNWSIAALNDGKLTYLLLAPLEPYQLARLL